MYLCMVTYNGPCKTQFDPNGHKSKTKVMKATDSTSGSIIFAPGTPCRLASSYSVGQMFRTFHC